MYIIVSCLLKTYEISHRSTYKTRLAARKNLQKEAQNWLLQTKPNNEWEVLASEKDATTKTKYFIIPSDTNEDIISVYERVENIQKGWIYNSTNVNLVKLANFTVLDITVESDEVETVRYITSPVSEKTVLTDSERLVIASKKNLLTNLGQNLIVGRENLKKVIVEKPNVVKNIDDDLTACRQNLKKVVIERLSELVKETN